MRKLCVPIGVILAATLVLPLQSALAKDGNSGGGGGSAAVPAPAPAPVASSGKGGSGKVVPVAVTPAPIAVSGTSIVIPAGTAFGTVVGFAPAVPGFPAAPIILTPTFQHGE